MNPAPPKARLRIIAVLMLTVWAGAGSVASSAVSSPPERSPRARETEAIMRDMMHIVYDQADLAGVKNKYFTPDFIQHNPEIANGREGDKAFIDARGARDPQRFLPVAQWVNKVDHVMVDDKYFAIHHRLYTNPNDPGRMFFDMWRVENGKIVEHWDIIQPIPAQTRNSNAMGGDLVPATSSAPGDPDPEAVIRDYLRIGLEQNDAAGAAQRYIADTFRQHSPHIPDGKAALIAYFKAKAQTPAASPRFNHVSHILHDGELVLVTRHTGNTVPTGPDDHGQMYADLFRVQHGLIVEHWDVIQTVPPQSVNGNTMW